MKRNTKQALAMAMAFVTGFSTMPINTSATSHINAKNEGLVTLPLGDEDYADEDSGISNLPLGDEDYAEEPVTELPPQGNQGVQVTDEETGEIMLLQEIGDLQVKVPIGGQQDDYYSYDEDQKTLTVKKNVSISNISSVTGRITSSSSTRIVIDASANQDITIKLEGVDIDSTTGSALEIPSSFAHNVTLKLKENTMNKLKGQTAGIDNQTSKQLTLIGEVSLNNISNLSKDEEKGGVKAGTLIATANDSGKGIIGDATITEYARVAVGPADGTIKTEDNSIFLKGLSNDTTLSENFSLQQYSGTVSFTGTGVTFDADKFKLTFPDTTGLTGAVTGSISRTPKETTPSRTTDSTSPTSDYSLQGSITIPATTGTDRSTPREIELKYIDMPNTATNLTEYNNIDGYYFVTSIPGISVQRSVSDSPTEGKEENMFSLVSGTAGFDLRYFYFMEPESNTTFGELKFNNPARRMGMTDKTFHPGGANGAIVYLGKLKWNPNSESSFQVPEDPTATRGEQYNINRYGSGSDTFATKFVFPSAEGSFGMYAPYNNNWQDETMDSITYDGAKMGYARAYSAENIKYLNLKKYEQEQYGSIRFDFEGNLYLPRKTNIIVTSLNPAYDVDSSTNPRTIDKGYQLPENKSIMLPKGKHFEIYIFSKEVDGTTENWIDLPVGTKIYTHDGNNTSTEETLSTRKSFKLSDGSQEDSTGKDLKIEIPFGANEDDYYTYNNTDKTLTIKKSLNLSALGSDASQTQIIVDNTNATEPINVTLNSGLNINTTTGPALQIKNTHATHPINVTLNGNTTISSNDTALEVVDTGTQPVTITLNGTNIKSKNGVALEVKDTSSSRSTSTGTNPVKIRFGNSNVNTIIGNTAGIKVAAGKSMDINDEIPNKANNANEKERASAKLVVINKGTDIDSIKADGQVNIGDNIKLATNSTTLESSSNITLATPNSTDEKKMGAIVQGIKLNDKKPDADEDTDETYSISKNETDKTTIKRNGKILEFPANTQGTFDPKTFKFTLASEENTPGTGARNTVTVPPADTISDTTIEIQNDNSSNTKLGTLTLKPGGSIWLEDLAKFDGFLSAHQTYFVFSEGGKIKKDGQKTFEVLKGQGYFNLNFLNDFTYIIKKNNISKLGDFQFEPTDKNFIGIVNSGFFNMGSFNIENLYINTTRSKISIDFSLNETTTNNLLGKEYTVGVGDGNLNMISVPADNPDNPDNPVTPIVDTQEEFYYDGTVISGKNRWYWQGGTDENPTLAFEPKNPNTDQITDRFKFDTNGEVTIPKGSKIVMYTEQAPKLRSSIVPIKVKTEYPLPENTGIKLPKGQHFSIAVEPDNTNTNQNILILPKGSTVQTYTEGSDTPTDKVLEFGGQLNLTTSDVTENQKINSTSFKVTKNSTDNSGFAEYIDGALNIQAGEVTLSNNDNNEIKIEEDVIITDDDRANPVVLNLKDVEFKGNLYVNSDKANENITINLENATIEGNIIIKNNSKSNVKINVVNGTTNNVFTIEKDGNYEYVGTLTIDDKENTTDKANTEKGTLNVKNKTASLFRIGSSRNTRNITINGSKLYIKSDYQGVGIGAIDSASNLRFDGDAEINITSGLLSTGIGAFSYVTKEGIFIGKNTKITISDTTGSSAGIGGVLNGAATLSKIHITDNAEIELNSMAVGIGTFWGKGKEVIIDGMAKVISKTDKVYGMNGTAIIGSVNMGSVEKLVLGGNALISGFISKDSLDGAIKVKGGEIKDNAIIQISSDGNKTLDEIFALDNMTKTSGLVMYRKENIRYGDKNFELRGMTIRDGNALVQTTDHPIVVKPGDTVTFEPGSFYITANKEFELKAPVNATGENSKIAGTLKEDGSVSLGNGNPIVIGSTTITPPTTTSKNGQATPVDQSLSILKNGNIKMPAGTTIQTGAIKIKTKNQVITFFENDGSYKTVTGMQFSFKDGKAFDLAVDSVVNVDDTVTLVRNKSFTLPDTTNKLQITLPLRKTGTISLSPNGTDMFKLTLPGGTKIEETEGSSKKTITLDESKIESITFEDKENRLSEPNENNYWHEKLKFESKDNKDQLVLLDNTSVNYVDTTKGTVVTPMGGWLNPSSMDVTFPTTNTGTGDFIIMNYTDTTNDYSYDSTNKTLTLKKSGLGVLNSKGGVATDNRIIIQPTDTTTTPFEVKLYGVDISTADTDAPLTVESSVNNSTEVVLTIIPGTTNKLTSTGTSAGISVEGGSKLTIKCQNTTQSEITTQDTTQHICDNTTGHLYVTGGTNKEGIDSTKPVDITGGILHLKGQGTANALKSTEPISITGGYVYADTDMQTTAGSPSTRTGSTTTTTPVESFSATSTNKLTINTNGFVRASKLPTASNVTKTKGLIFDGITGTVHGDVKILADLELPVDLTTITKQNGSNITFDNPDHTVNLTFRKSNKTTKTGKPATIDTKVRLLDGATVNALKQIEATGNIVIGNGVNQRKITASQGAKFILADNYVTLPKGTSMLIEGSNVTLQQADIKLPMNGNETFNITADGMEIPLGTKAIIGSTELTFEQDSNQKGGNGYLSPRNMTITFPQGVTAKAQTGSNNNDMKETTLTIPPKGTLRLEIKRLPSNLNNPTPIAMVGTGGTLLREDEYPVKVIQGEIGIAPNGSYVIGNNNKLMFRNVILSYSSVLSATPESSSNLKDSLMDWNTSGVLNLNDGTLLVGENELSKVSGSISRKEIKQSTPPSNTDDKIATLSTIYVNGIISGNVNIKPNSILEMTSGNTMTINNVSYSPKAGELLYFSKDGYLVAVEGSSVAFDATEAVKLPTDIYLPKGNYGELKLNAAKDKLILPAGSKYKHKTRNVVLELPTGGELEVASGTATPTDFKAVTDITINMPTEVSVDAKIPVVTTINPTDATYKNIVWTVTDNATGTKTNTTNASITDDVFTATSEGTYKITATIVDGKASGEDATTEQTITVKGKQTITVKTPDYNGKVVAEQNTIDQTTGEVLVPNGGSQTFTITADEGYVIDTVKDTDKNTSITKSTTNGTNLSGQTTGTYTINNVTTDKTMEVTFKKLFVPVTNIELLQGNTMLQTDSLKLKGKVTPENATNQTIVWSLKSDDNTAEAELLNDELTVTKQGKFTVTATITDGKSTDSTTTDKDYTQDFEITVVGKTYEITTSAYAGGKIISPSRFNRSKFIEDKVVKVPENGDQTFIIQADNGYRIESLSLDGVDVTDEIKEMKNQNPANALKSGTYTIQDVTNGHILTAKFKKLPGTEVTGKASFGAGKLPSVTDLTSENGLTIDNTKTNEEKEGYIISRTLTEKTEKTPKSVIFAITKKDDKKPAIAVTLNAKNDNIDLSNVGITLKATANSTEFDFTLTGIVEGEYDIITYKKNHTYATYTNISVVADKVSLETKMEMLAGDLNGDGSVDVTDYGALMGNYDSVSAEYDIDDAGKVDITDYGALMGNYDAKANVYPKANN